MDITHVELLHAHVVQLRFADGVEKSIDLEPYLHGRVFPDIRSDPTVFAAVTVDPDAGTIVWPNGAASHPTCSTKVAAPHVWSPKLARAEPGAAGVCPGTGHEDPRRARCGRPVVAPSCLRTCGRRPGTHP